MQSIVEREHVEEQDSTRSKKKTRYIRQKQVMTVVVASSVFYNTDRLALRPRSVSGIHTPVKTERGNVRSLGSMNPLMMINYTRTR